ncbi:hypothetical protein [Stutzerimonas stutzeri]|uniref:Uncharacterized protein n=1 Tax=Stutzerimonas stutzeri TaxID=316 RepID=A0A6I6LFC1_STUST|nr:hypothetical protein [Stutzerimonas stutzeri]QGZ28998.1 hypothetical protein GQA94_02535 [Stutzerimonas stutzeri]
MRNDRLAELLTLTSHSMSQLAEALTTFSFELMASEDPAVRIASRRMVSRVSAIRSAFDQKAHALEPAVAPCVPGLDQPQAGLCTDTDDRVQSPGKDASDH